MRFFRRIAAFFIAAVLMLSFCITASAEDPFDYDLYDGLSEYEGHYYKVFNRAVTWEEAEQFCERLGGTLAAINSAGENGFVAGLVSSGSARNCYWLGMRGGAGGWELVTGEPASYFNWAPNEPNNFENHAESYVHMFGVRYTGGKGIKEVGHWNDVINDGAEYAGEFYAAGNFGFVCEWADRDGDGLFDGWEERGIDVDADGTVDVPIHTMGADPDVQDIFVEIDWMERSQKKFFAWEIRSYVNYAPTRAALQMVCDVFADHGIRLHIDAGTNSVNMGAFTAYEGASEISYKEVYRFEKAFDDMEDHMGAGRLLAFRYCIFANQYSTGGSTTTSSGVAYMGGPVFLIANQDWVRNGGTISVAGTFMHELGHCLDLDHGGQDGVNYKPNYLSIMNYLFQTTGLPGTLELNYSEYALPTLNENALNENDGIDPNGHLAGTLLGTSWYNGGVRQDVVAVAGDAVDFNCNGTMEPSVSVDLNNEGDTVLTSYTDWDKLDIPGWCIGGGQAGGSLEETLAEQVPVVDRDLEEALRTNTLAQTGGHSVRLVSDILLSDARQQSLMIELSNRTAVEETYRVTITADSLTEKLEQEVTVPASVKQIETVRIPVPVADRLKEGTYTLKVEVSCRDQKTEQEFSVTVTTLTAEEREQLLELVEDGTLEEYGLDPDVAAQITTYARQPMLRQYLPYLLAGALCVSALGAIIMTIVLIVKKKRKR